MSKALPTPSEPPLAAAGETVAEAIPVPAGVEMVATPEGGRGPDAEDLPDLIVLDRDFGFSKAGVLRVWAAGQPITKRADIAELLAFDAPCSAYRLIKEPRS